MAAGEGFAANPMARHAKFDGKREDDGTHGFGAAQRFGKGKGFGAAREPASNFQPGNARGLRRPQKQESKKKKLFQKAGPLEDTERAFPKIKGR